MTCDVDTFGPEEEALKRIQKDIAAEDGGEDSLIEPGEMSISGD